MSPVVTEVQVQKRSVVAVSVSRDADGDDTVVLPLDTVVLHHLQEGLHLPPDRWAEIRTEGRRLLAVREALAVLSRRQRTERELRTALGRTFEPDEVDHAVERMRGLGYLDDAAWSRSYVASPRAMDRGRALLRHELGQRGVARPVAAEAVAAHDDRAAALEAARKRVRSLRSVEEPKRSRRLYDFLLRRGFSSGVAQEAMAQALHAVEETRRERE